MRIRTLGLLLASSLAVSQPAAAQEQRALFIGNSFTAWNGDASVGRVYEGLAERGPSPVSDVEVAIHAPGATLLLNHAADARGDNGDVPLRRQFVDAAGQPVPWDLVVLQEQSQVSGFEPGSGLRVSMEESAAALHAMAGERGAETFMLMTWGRREGDTQSPERFPDFVTMQRLVAAGYDDVAAAISTPDRPVWVIPAGMAWQAIYDDLQAANSEPVTPGSTFWELYSDGSHPSVAGSYLAGCVTYATVTGRTPVGIDWAPPGGPVASERAALQAVGARVVFDAPRARPYRWLRTWRQHTMTAGPTASEVSIGAAGMRLQIHVDGPSAAAPAVRIGSAEGDAALVVNATGALRTDQLVVGDEADGTLELRGGSLTTERVVLARADGSRGSLRVVNGEARLGEVLAGRGEAQPLEILAGTVVLDDLQGSIDQQGGILEVGRGVATLGVSGDLVVGSDGAIAIDIVDPHGEAGTGYDTLRVRGRADLAGVMQIRSSETGADAPRAGLVLLTAAAVTANEVRVEGGIRGTLQVVDRPDGDQALLLVGVGEGPTTADPATTSDAGSAAGDGGPGTADAGTASAQDLGGFAAGEVGSVTRVRGDASGGANPGAGGSSGCHGGAGAAAWPLLMLALRRRRRGGQTSPMAA